MQAWLNVHHKTAGQGLALLAISEEVEDVLQYYYDNIRNNIVPAEPDLQQYFLKHIGKMYAQVYDSSYTSSAGVQSSLSDDSIYTSSAGVQSSLSNDSTYTSSAGVQSSLSNDSTFTISDTDESPLLAHTLNTYTLTPMNKQLIMVNAHLAMTHQGMIKICN